MTLTDAWAKLTRARSLSTELVRATKAFRDSDPYEFLQFSNENDETDPQLRLQWRLHVKTPYPMQAAWIVGDAIQNMRAALDTALAMVVTHEAETQPTPEEWRRIQYPITDTPDMFKPQRKKLAKWVSAATVEAVEEHQPWKEEGSSDDSRFLAKLRDLSNTDKHQQLLVADHAVVNTEFKMNGLAPQDLDIRPRKAVMKDGEHF